MAKRYKLKKEALIFLGIILLVIIALIAFIVSLFKSNSYSMEYNLSDYKVNENYDGNKKLYYFEIKYQDNIYNFVQESKYLKTKKIIKEVNYYEDGNYSCITIDSSHFKNNPLCLKGKEAIDYRLVSDKLKEELHTCDKEYEETEEDSYTIYSDSSALVWSYKGFNSIRGRNIKFIKLFDRDVYNLPLATKINNFLVIPDYEQEHSFNKVYIINLETDELDEWKLEYSISFESYLLGINDRSIFWMDTKNKKEYELVPHKKRMRIVAKNNQQGIIYEKNEQKKYQLNKIILNNMKFIPELVYNYEVINNKLYLWYLNNENHKILVSDNEIKDIIYTEKDNVYYLVADTLYKYNLKEGETKLIKYAEWDFNYENLIFISK
jgi:hypothetical protein